LRQFDGIKISKLTKMMIEHYSSMVTQMSCSIMLVGIAVCAGLATSAQLVEHRTIHIAVMCSTFILFIYLRFTFELGKAVFGYSHISWCKCFNVVLRKVTSNV